MRHTILAAALAVAIVPVAASAATATFEFTATDMPVTTFFFNGSSVPFTAQVSVSGTLVADQTGSSSYTVTGLTDFVLTASDSFLENIITDGVVLDDGVTAPTAPATITWDGTTPTGWSLNSNLLFSGATTIAYGEFLSLFADNGAFYSQSGVLPIQTGTAASDIRANGTWVAGDATGHGSAVMPLPAAA
ncbi:MAG: hypothetical protein V2I65_00735 [Paracoccaceae bacterium]|jgi:hypothetical protein|nr:hypothetical protein [Paracoccaceae bacterium]